MEKEQIKESLGLLPTLAEGLKKLQEDFKSVFGKKEKFVDAKLKDGTIIRYDGEMPMAGMPLQVIGTDGAVMPAPDGDHVLEDGSILVVKEGVIMEVKPSEAPAQDMEGAPATPDETATQKEAKRIIESIVKESVFADAKSFNELKEAFENHKKEYEAVVNENKSLKEKIEKIEGFSKQMFELIEKIADEPQEKGHKPKDGFKKSESNRDKMRDMMDSAKDLSNKVFKN